MNKMQNNTSVLVFLNGILLGNYQYEITYSFTKIMFFIPLNSQAQNTSTNVIIVKNGVKIYEERIEKQNISTINLYSGEMSE